MEAFPGRRKVEEIIGLNVIVQLLSKFFHHRDGS